MQKMSLKAFAGERAVNGAITAALVNMLVVYFSLSDLSEVPIFVLVAEHWKQSLVGALVPRAVLISVLVTLATVWTTVNSRAAGEVHPPIDANLPWFGITLRVALRHAATGPLLVIIIALTLRLLFPAHTTVSSTLVVFFVAIFAGAMAFLMSYTAVLKSAGPPRRDVKEETVSLPRTQ